MAAQDADGDGVGDARTAADVDASVLTSIAAMGADEFATSVATLAASLPLNRLLHLEPREVREGHAEVLLPARDEVRNHVGTVHAIAALAPAEMAAATAATSRLGDLVAAGYVPVVRSLSVRYLAGASGDVVAVADVEAAAAESARAAHAAGRRPSVEVAVALQDGGVTVAEVTVDLVFVDAGG